MIEKINLFEPSMSMEFFNLIRKLYMNVTLQFSLRLTSNNPCSALANKNAYKCSLINMGENSAIIPVNNTPIPYMVTPPNL